jgi:hypothetical protein
MLKWNPSLFESICMFSPQTRIPLLMSLFEPFHKLNFLGDLLQHLKAALRLYDRDEGLGPTVFGREADCLYLEMANDAFTLLDSSHLDSILDALCYSESGEISNASVGLLHQFCCQSPHHHTISLLGHFLAIAKDPSRA